MGTISDFSNQPFINHLEFLGYEVIERDQKIIARHARHFNFIMRSFAGGMLLTIYFGGSELGKRDRDGFLRVINALNQAASAARYYVDEDSDLVMEGYYPCEYNKKTFGVFMDAMNREKISIAKFADELTPYLE